MRFQSQRPTGRLFPGRRRPLTTGFAPRSLFRNGEQGFWYDPSDLSTLFQDASGTAPVTDTGQPVGLMLDKRLGLVRGPELVANGTFEDGIVGWTSVTGSVTAVSGQMRIENTTATEAFAQLDAVTFLAGRTYEIRMDAPMGRVSVSGGFARVGAGPGVGLRLILTATGGSLRIGTNGTTAGLAVAVDNISVRELPGNHALQPAAALRPMLRDNPRRIDYDQVDDALTVPFTSSLGTACTIARSIPGVGAQILTAQTIGSSYVLNVDSCADVVVNRALTPTETANLTRYLNRRAGV